MSKKSKPGDGTQGRGTKGGAIDFAPEIPTTTFIQQVIRSLRNIRRIVAR